MSTAIMRRSDYYYDTPDRLYFEPITFEDVWRSDSERPAV